MRFTPVVVPAPRPRTPLEVTAYASHMLFHRGVDLASLGDESQRCLVDTPYALTDDHIREFNKLLLSYLPMREAIKPTEVCDALDDLEDLGRRLN